MKKLPAIVPFPKKQKDDAMTAELKKVIRRGIGYTLVGTRRFDVPSIRPTLYPSSCHQSLHQVMESVICYRLGLSLEAGIARLTKQRPCYYRREMTGGRYDTLKEIVTLPTLCRVAYQMATGQRFNDEVSGMAIFLVLADMIDATIKLMEEWGVWHISPEYPLPPALESLGRLPVLYQSHDTIWAVSARRIELKKIDLFYPIVQHFLAQGQSTTPVCQQIGVINPFVGQYAVLNMEHFSPKVYKEIQQFIGV